MFTVNDLIDIAVKMERNGETLYLASRQKAQSPQLKSLLKWMAEGEAAHGTWFADKKGKWLQTPARPIWKPCFRM